MCATFTFVNECKLTTLSLLDVESWQMHAMMEWQKASLCVIKCASEPLASQTIDGELKIRYMKFKCQASKQNKDISQTLAFHVWSFGLFFFSLFCFLKYKLPFQNKKQVNTIYQYTQRAYRMHKYCISSLRKIMSIHMTVSARVRVRGMKYNMNNLNKGPWNWNGQ